MNAHGPAMRADAAAPHPGRRPPGDPRPLRRGVICAVDDDRAATSVIATAAGLADRLDVPLTVAHSAHPDRFLSGEPHRLAIDRGHELVDRVTAGYRVDERVVEVDDPGRLILGLAREGASLVVIGTRGRTGLRAALLGSVSHAVIAGADCPVVTVSEVASQIIDAAGRSERLAVVP